MASLPMTVPAKNVEVPEDLWEQAGLLPCILTVEVGVKNFNVGDLLRLERGAIVESKAIKGADVPVSINARVIGWAEFEVVGQRLALRLTDLA